jgi:hypothetical protein
MIGYQLTDRDKEIIEECVYNGDMEKLLLFVSAVGSIGMIKGWQAAQEVVNEYGIEALNIKSCGGCSESCDKDKCKED